MTETWRELLARATSDVGSDREARWLVEEASGYDAAELVLGLDQPAGVLSQKSLARMVERRKNGEPLQYVLRRWSFRRLDLHVDPRVLIPRPETEQVVGWAIEEARALDRHPIKAADLGTGSGAIALSLAAELGAHVWATDISADALDVATANMAGAGMVARRVTALQGDWWDALPANLERTLDLVVSNPPYVADDDPLPPEVEDYEPKIALRAGPDGMDAIRRIVDRAPEWLAPSGVLVVELDPRQARPAAALARDNDAVRTEIKVDALGRDRALVAQW